MPRVPDFPQAMLKIYNTLTRGKQPFVPITSGKVNMYVCGMTVYDYCHLGHARVLVVFDVVQRWFRASDYAVNYVRNITDIDDKIIKRAAENREPVDTLTARFIRFMEEDAQKLGVEKPVSEPRASAYVGDMVQRIKTLIDKGLAYHAANGDVYYAVSKFPAYGKLSGKSLEDLRAGERVEIGAEKRDPLDFVLWKAAKPDEPWWDSPWGKGRPGWHIECSVMSEKLLGITSTFTAAARICSSPITKTKSRNPKAPTAILSSITGCTTALCAWMSKRCRSRSAIFLPCAKC